MCVCVCVVAMCVHTQEGVDSAYSRDGEGLKRSGSEMKRTTLTLQKRDCDAIEAMCAHTRCIPSVFLQS